MALSQNIGRIDHVVISVYPENLERCVEKLSRVLGVTFSAPIPREDLGVIAAISWEAGLEVLAPTEKGTALWQRIEERGEGNMSVVFGVKDIDEAKKRAVAEGVNVSPEIGLVGHEPWVDQFEVLRESVLDEIFGTNIILGQIEPQS